MKVYITINNEDFQVDYSNPISLAIPLHFNGEQPNTYDVDRATAQAYREGNFVGSVKEGGSCNFEQYTFIPHCNGTHTEGVGHLSLERIAIDDILNDLLIPATLISVAPEAASKTVESYIPALETDDLVITKKQLAHAIAQIKKFHSDSLIIRTLPNLETKKSQRYMEQLPPFFTQEAMQYIHELGFKHLLVDMPSVDRTFDDGRMTNHCIFWDTTTEDRNIDPKAASLKTITEMIYVPNHIEDGLYLLNIQIPAFVADAAPSRPVLYQYSKK